MKHSVNRREFMGRLGAGLFVTGIASALPRPLWAQSAGEGADLAKLTPRQRYDLDIAYQPFRINGKTEPVSASAINGTVPGPLMHWREGETVQLNMNNSLMDTEHASIHWHGILVPFPMDGVPGVNFAGIKPGQTFSYRYPLEQSGTYWYHSHSAFQEQTGTYGPLVIEPRGGDPIRADRLEYRSFDEGEAWLWPFRLLRSGTTSNCSSNPKANTPSAKAASNPSRAWLPSGSRSTRTST